MAALIVGVTGIVGLPLAQQLLDKKWKVYGVSRRYADYLPSGLKHVSLDVTKKEDCAEKLKGLADVTHVFFTVWVNAATEEERCKINKGIIEDVLNSLPGKLKRVVLMTGGFHYIGNFEDFLEKGKDPKFGETLATPWKESLPRPPGQSNFYYDQEDVLFKLANEKGFSWNVSRPSAIIGFAPGNIINVATNIAVYASICKHLDLPFVFPGGRRPLKGQVYFDYSDADLIAEHLIWEATNPEAKNQIFNVANGDPVQWREVWATLAEYFGLRTEEPGEEPMDVEKFKKDKESVWAEIVAKHGLKKTALSDLTNWYIMTAVVSIPVTFMLSATKTREFGFNSFISNEKSFLKLFDKLRKEKYIP